MNQICVATTRASAYYALVSRLRGAGLPFDSVLPESAPGGCDVVLTTAEEASKFGRRALALEDLDEDPGVFKGQVVSRLNGEKEVILIGVDPGQRTGVAVFYGQVQLASTTLDSVNAVCSRVAAFASRIPFSHMLVRVGNGNRLMANKLVDALRQEVPVATIELVDESGTSSNGSKIKGVQRDEVSAAKIAFRKGDVVSHGSPRSRG